MKRAGCLAVAGLAAVVMCAGSLLACDDHVGKCEMEAWRVLNPMGRMVVVEGATTCDKGDIRMRFYDGDKFLGVADGIISGHAFSATALDINVKGADLKIKYSIEPE